MQKNNHCLVVFTNFVLCLSLATWILYAKPLWANNGGQPRAISPRGALTRDEQSTIGVFEKSKFSVVYITTISQIVDFWTRNVTEVPSGTGSGFVWDEQGHIVTNYHVVEGAQAANIRLTDQRSFQGRLIGASPEYDLAVLRININALSAVPLPIGTSANLRVGQKVIAIGNPFGLDYSLTTGVISALNRTLSTGNDQEIRNLIQTDAAINPGNSGGPLLDSAGRLIGINTAIYSPSGAYAGVGFAVPVDTINRVVPQLIAYGSYRRPSIGIMLDDEISQNITRQLRTEGVLILKVEPGSAADRAGLQGTRLRSDGSVIPGDIIQSINGKPIKVRADIHELLDRHKVGERVILGIERNGEKLNVQVILRKNRG